MKKEFNLSEKRKELKKRVLNNHETFVFNIFRLIEKQDKEFIERIKATMLFTPSPTDRGEFIVWLGREIDKLAGSSSAPIKKKEMAK